MKKVLFSLFALLATTAVPCSTATTMAAEQEPSGKTQPKKTREIILLKQQEKPKVNRAPAKPLYGFYDGSILSLAIECSDANETATLRISSPYSTIEYCFTINELTQGVNIDLYEDTQIELILADGTVYNSL